MSDMHELIERLESAGQGSEELDRAIFLALYPNSPAGPASYSRSLDAALSLVPERGDGYLLWRIILERKPLHTGPAWFATVREHAKSGGAAVAHTAPLALTAATLRARFPEAAS